MTRTNQNINDLTAGDTLLLEIPVVNDEGLAEDLTGAIAEWVLAPRAGAHPLISKSSTRGEIVIVGANSDTLRIQLTPEDTEPLSGTYYHEAEVTDTDGNVATVTTGWLTFNEDTT